MHFNMKPICLLRPLIGAAFSWVMTMTAAFASPQLACELQIAKAQTIGQPVTLSFTLRNTGARAAWVLAWNTPLEGLRGRFLRVTGPKGELAYLGPQFKRAQPDGAQYHRVAAGQSLSASVDLGLAYALDAPGRYRLTYTGHLLDVVQAPAQPPRAMDDFQPQQLRCPSLSWEMKP